MHVSPEGPRLIMSLRGEIEVYFAVHALTCVLDVTSIGLAVNLGGLLLMR